MRMVNTSLTFSRHYLDPLLWWLQNTRWTEHAAARERYSHTFQLITSFYEMVVNFELTIGVRVLGDDWAEQASRLADMIRYVARIFLLTNDASLLAYKAFFGPAKNVASLPIRNCGISG